MAVENEVVADEAVVDVEVSDADKVFDAPKDKAPDEKVEDGAVDNSDADSKTDDEEKVGAPDTYEDFTVPEGMELDAEMVEKFTPIAKELGLTQEGAQKLVDLFNEKVADFGSSQAQNWERVQTEWQTAAKADKEYGGQAFKENVGYAHKALEQFGTPELREALDLTGVGNHPEFIRAFVKIGKAISEDKIRTGSNPAGAPRDQSKVMFPDMN